jgi:malate dehydrogenase (oxaloacetate-decarboxylating)
MSSDSGPVTIDVEGAVLLTTPLLNKGTAFTEEERTAFSLHGLLPPRVGTLEAQVARRLQAVRAFDRDLDRHFFLRGLQDANETLFYALIVRHLTEMLPLVYTPTVGQACERFSHYWHFPRGLFLSWPHRDLIDEILSHPRYDKIETIVVSDGERILGLGDQGAGGMGIPIGKLSLYTACAGLDPATTLPIMLDTGTDNAERIADPLYMGWKHERVRGADYDSFIELFVTAVMKRWPRVLLQWEDFARINAGRLLDRYRNRLCSFNDDIQGTAAVAAATVLAGAKAIGVPLREQRFVLFGAGTAGCGIGRMLLDLMTRDGLTPAEAKRQFFAVDRGGLLSEAMMDLEEFQKPFAKSRNDVAGWDLSRPDRIDLLDTVRNVRPTVLIGTSGQPGMFSEEVVRAMAKAVARPLIFPLSNPVSRCEATPADLVRWTDGRALIGTGSPFPPVTIDGMPFTVDQTNNAYIFPGVGLGVHAVEARRISDGMFIAAAKALADLAPLTAEGRPRLLPPIAALREVAVVVARAVARQAKAEGLCDDFEESALDGLIAAKRWEPVYRPYHRPLAEP